MELLTVLLPMLLAIQATDVDGKAVNLFDSKQVKPVVLVFVRTDCPISNRYAPELRRLYQKFSSNFSFYAVYPDNSETATTVQKHASEYGLSVPVLRDVDHSLVAMSRARVTPEVALFSPRGRLLYHGRIDDRYVSVSTARPQPTVHDLENALNAVLRGQPVRVSSTPAIGCALADVQ